MKLSTPQRNFLFLGMVLAIALLPLVGGMHHHHHDDAAGVCWFCTTASASALPVYALLVAVMLAWVAPPVVGQSAPSWFIWMARHRRGPPCLSIA